MTFAWEWSFSALDFSFSKSSLDKSDKLWMALRYLEAVSLSSGMGNKGSSSCLAKVTRLLSADSELEKSLLLLLF